MKMQNYLFKLALSICLVGKLNAFELPAPLTSETPSTPLINGPDIFGVRTGSAFLYTIPATGERPMAFGADNWPASLKLDEVTGNITGGIVDKRNYPVVLRGSNSLGPVDKKIVPAEAKLDGDMAVVSRPAVAAPIVVRCAWGNYPVACKLFNAAGLPVAQFCADVPKLSVE